jgi:signal transduction histidine kinase
LQSRTKTFLTFALICIVPLLVISILSFLGNLRFDESQISQNLGSELVRTTNNFNLQLHDRENEQKGLAWNEQIRKLVSSADREALDTSGDVAGVRESFDQLLHSGKSYAAIAAFSPNRRLFLVAEAPPGGNGSVVFRAKDFSPGRFQLDEAVWTDSHQEPRCNVLILASIGETLRCTTAVFVLGDEPTTHGALVADIKLDGLFSRIDNPPDPGSNRQTPEQLMIVLDHSGTIAYHTNDALRHQPVSGSMPYFAPVADEMSAERIGTKFYRGPDGNDWLASYQPIQGTNLSLAVARNFSTATRSTRLLGWLTIILALVLGAGSTVLLATYYLKRTQSIDRVAAGVGAIAHGKLDHRFDLGSSDDLRSLADNVDLVTQQLREQIAREAESQQFQTFVRLSAVLTHDLKNAIAALSLIVTNMEKHSDNPEFRADAMKSLTGATGKLEALVTRLSNPVVTLSGEHKRPEPVDLVPMLKRVVSMTAEHLRDQHEITLNLPEPVFALVDIERVGKVAENLVINAIEAMASKGGALTMSAGKTADGKVFFSVTDTGEGMSRRFIEERLFRPFATTKRKGVGLGLYTCREVVRANGGSIEVESEQGAGTTFRVVLPSPPFEGAA